MCDNAPNPASHLSLPSVKINKKKMISFKNIFHLHCPQVRPTASSYYCLLLRMPRMSQSSNHEGKAKKKEAVSRK
jgi:hypothetical protein